MKTKIKFSQEDILKVLDTCYEKTTNGISKISPSIDRLAGDYLSKHASKEEAIKVK